MNHLISVIVPNYNKSQWIKECIESLINQTYANLEIIFVDDFSTDDSVKVIESIDDGRIKIITNRENRGVSYCRNIGIKEAKGKYVTTLDSDDKYLTNTKIEDEYMVLERHNFDCIAFSNVSQIDKNSEILSTQGNSSNIREGRIFKSLIKRGWTSPTDFSPRDFLLPKDFLVDVGLFDESLNLYEDWDLKIRLSLKYEFFYSNNHGIGYRRIDGLSFQPLESHYKNLALIKRRYQSNVGIFVERISLRFKKSYSVLRRKLALFSRGK